jgi:hypothetical protein
MPLAQAGLKIADIPYTKMPPAMRAQRLPRFLTTKMPLAQAGLKIADIPYYQDAARCAGSKIADIPYYQDAARFASADVLTDRFTDKDARLKLRLMIYDYVNIIPCVMLL